MNISIYLSISSPLPEFNLAKTSPKIPGFIKKGILIENSPKWKEEEEARERRKKKGRSGGRRKKKRDFFEVLLLPLG